MTALRAQLRLGAALAHALPGCRLELRGPDGDALLVGFDPGCELSPCLLRQVLLEASETGAPRLADVEAHLNDNPPGVRHVGLGVYRYRAACCFGYVFATVLPPSRVAQALGESPPDDEAADPVATGLLHFHADEQLGITLLFTRFPAAASDDDLAEDAERHALRAAGACLAVELIDRAVGDEGWS